MNKNLQTFSHYFTLQQCTFCGLLPSSMLWIITSLGMPDFQSAFEISNITFSQKSSLPENLDFSLKTCFKQAGQFQVVTSLHELHNDGESKQTSSVKNNRQIRQKLKRVYVPSSSLSLALDYSLRVNFGK